MNFAIIGATGNVGRKTIEILEKSKLHIKNLYLIASARSKGKSLSFRGKPIQVKELGEYDFKNANITFFAAGSKFSEQWAEKASKKTIVIDNSRFFRMNKNPLVSVIINCHNGAKFLRKCIQTGPVV